MKYIIVLSILLYKFTLVGQDYNNLGSGTYYNSNPTQSFIMDTLIEAAKETRWKKITSNGKTEYKGLDYEIVRDNNLQIKKQYDFKGVLNNEKTTIIRSEFEVTIVEKYVDTYEVYTDSTFKLYNENKLLKDCISYSYVSDTIVTNSLTHKMRTINEYDDFSGQIVQITDYTDQKYLKSYFFIYDSKGRIEKIEVRDSMNYLGRYCLFKYIKRSENSLYRANWYRADSVLQYQTIFEEDLQNYSKTQITKEYAMMYDNDFSPLLKPYQRTIVFTTTHLNLGNLRKVEYDIEFKDHELVSFRKFSYDRRGRLIRDEISTDGKNFGSRTTYWYKVKKIS